MYMGSHGIGREEGGGRRKKGMRKGGEKGEWKVREGGRNERTNERRGKGGREEGRKEVGMKGGVRDLRERQFFILKGKAACKYDQTNAP